MIRGDYDSIFGQSVFIMHLSGAAKTNHDLKKNRIDYCLAKNVNIKSASA